MLYDVPKPTEAILITGGMRKRPESNPYRIVVGGGAWSIPFLHRVRRFYIGTHTVQVRVAAPSSQNVEVAVEATVVFRVRPDKNHITRAASRFEGSDRNDVRQTAYDIFGGETRAMIGQMTVEEMISDRMRLASDVLTNAEPKMAELGWGIDSFQISSITDDNNYIRSLSAPELARVEREKAVAEARRDAEIENERQKAERLKSEYQRDTDLMTSENIKQSAQAKAEAEASGPLAKAEADKQLAQRNGELKIIEAKAEAEAAGEKSKADAKAKTEQAEAEQATAAAQTAWAEARAKTAAAEQEALTIEARGEAARQVIAAEAEAAADKARGEAITEQELEQLRIQTLPSVIESLSSVYQGADLTVVGDQDGMTSMLANIAGVAPSIAGMIKNITSGEKSPVAAPPASPQQF